MVFHDSIAYPSSIGMRIALASLGFLALYQVSYWILICDERKYTAVISIPMAERRRYLLPSFIENLSIVTGLKQKL